MNKPVQHQIEFDSTDSGHMNSATYRARPRLKELEKQETVQMLVMCHIEEAQMEGASPIVFVMKKNCTLRFRAEYQTLNALKIWNPYSI